jgi:Family of unknown function (DUF6194)
MNENEVIHYLTGTFDNIETVSVAGDTFFFYKEERKFPFATLVTHDDDYDQSANLNRPGVFRLNIGVSKQTFRSLLGATTPDAETAETVDSKYDFTTLNQIMPHPVYGKMYWVGILNPSPSTFQEIVQPLLAEAYEMAVTKHNKSTGRK